MASYPNAEFDKRWPHNKVSFTTEHHWTVGQFPIVDKSTGETSKEKTLSPKFEVDDHELQLQMTLQFLGKKAENDKERVEIGLNCYLGKEITSEVDVTIRFIFHKGLPFLGNIFGMNRVYIFK